MLHKIGVVLVSGPRLSRLILNLVVLKSCSLYEFREMLGTPSQLVLMQAKHGSTSPEYTTMPGGCAVVPVLTVSSGRGVYVPSGVGVEVLKTANQG